MSKKALSVLRNDFLSLLEGSSITDDVANQILDSLKNKVHDLPMDKGFFDLNTYLLDRPDCETNPNYLQVIPYIAFTTGHGQNKKVFTYMRGGKGDENRLHGNRSIGVGGHVERSVNSAETFLDILIDGTQRESQEEIKMNVPYDVVKNALTNARLFWNRETEVDVVHLGIAFDINVSDSDITGNEEGIIENGRMVYVDELKKGLPGVTFENWSKMLLKHI